MKLLTFLLCCIACHFLHAQDSLVTNSFKSLYAQSNPSLHYAYIEATQTHDYSGNWDIDGDGKTDSIYFTGNGGAHLYFNLAIALSTDNKPRSYDFILLDMPLLGYKKDIASASAFMPAFVVDNFDADAAPEIYIVFDKNFSSIPIKWKKKGLRSNRLLLNYRNGDIVISNYTQ